MKIAVMVVAATIAAGAYSAVHATKEHASQVWKMPNIGTIRSFSVGTARPKSFSSRPSAQDLHAAAMQLYNSFDTIAVSYTYTTSFINHSQWSESEGMTDIERMTQTSKKELRYHRPDRYLALTTDNGKPTFVFGASGGKYFTHTFARPDRWPQDTNHTSDYVNSVLWQMGVQQEKEVVVSGMRLLPDAKVGGTDTYVLEWTSVNTRMDKERERLGLGPATPQTNVVYLGKRDLLPRKVVVSSQTAEEKRQGIVDQCDTRVFTGFQGNVKLPDSLFMLPAKK